MNMDDISEAKRHIYIIGYAGAGFSEEIIRFREQFTDLVDDMAKVEADFREVVQKAMGVIDAEIISKFEKLGLTPEQMWCIQRIIQPERPKLELVDFLQEPEKEKKKGYQKKNRFWER